MRPPSYCSPIRSFFPERHCSVPGTKKEASPASSQFITELNGSSQLTALATRSPTSVVE